jgi:hypothetical protein
LWEKNCPKGKAFSTCEKNIDFIDNKYLKSFDKILHPDGTFIAFYLNTWRVGYNIAVLRYWGR